MGPNNDIWGELVQLDQQIDGRLLQTLRDALAAYYGDRAREPYENELPHVAFLRVLEVWLEFLARIDEVTPVGSSLALWGYL